MLLHPLDHNFLGDPKSLLKPTLGNKYINKYPSKHFEYFILYFYFFFGLGMVGKKVKTLIFRCRIDLLKDEMDGKLLEFLPSKGFCNLLKSPG